MNVAATAAAKAKDAVRPFGPEISFIIKVSRVPDTAKSNDLREFFSGITIPFGGLVILGGSEGDAFVGFTTDESARLAMEREGSTLHGSKISVRLSSRTEMENLLAKRFAEIAILSQLMPKKDETEVKPADALRTSAASAEAPFAAIGLGVKEGMHTNNISPQKSNRLLL
jgi:RNA recognition motif-containing protein